uniref:Uncharacterized protein n=1 Tax=Chromera velia CCMP2878 TaxID=1169474 RepID=A0A0G4EZ73_9ALVE|eukprot:Cvel_14356.t1-p1 / transcript=Cvel_14356.t1 / gene=Cvel_14356 / organism=Chromera_velia_CCMP2878 / gene_product=hypothetical protein / transcript_product=hypothetical protein / location=Cvel_scaffold1018:10940-12196(+) / protein_length=419 / sequence_SO=supercontig / SO=protein_coding / is_pseudo=false
MSTGGEKAKGKAPHASQNSESLGESPSKMPKPGNPVAFWRSILSPPQSNQAGLDTDLAHLYMELLHDWAEPKDAVEAWGSGGKVRELTKALVQAILVSGQVLQDLKRGPMRGAQIKFACQGCNPSYEGGCCQSVTVPLPMIPLIHHANVLLSGALALLLWDSEELSEIQNEILSEILVEAPPGVNLPQFLQQSVVEGKPPVLPVLLGVVDNAQELAPKLALNALKLMSILVLRRPGPALQQMDELVLAEAIGRFSLYLLNLTRDPCKVKTWFGMSYVLDILPLLYFLGMMTRGKKAVAVIPNLVQILIAISEQLGSFNHDGEVDVPFPVEEFGCLRTAFPATMTVHAKRSATSRALLETHPASFTAACVVELLHWWEIQGVPVRSCSVDAFPSKEEAKRMTKKERNHSPSLDTRSSKAI